MTSKKNGRKRAAICVFALVCVALMVSTSVMCLTDNSKNGSDINWDEYNPDGTFIGEKERFNELLDSNENTFKDGYLTYQVTSRNTCKVIDYKGSQRDVVVPDTVSYGGVTYTVDGIGIYGLSSKSPFARHPHTVELGPNIGLIDDSAMSFMYAFPGADEMTKFTIRDLPHSKLRTIGECAFAKVYCKTMEFPESLRTIDKGAFFRCGTTDIILHSPTLTLGDEVFYCSCMTNIDLSHVTHFGWHALYTCRISHIVFSKDLQYIGPCLGNMTFYDVNGNVLPSTADGLRGKEFNETSSNKFVEVPHKSIQ